MLEAIVDATGNVELVRTDRPAPGPNQVLIKVFAAGVNPKDWKFPALTGKAHNSGDDVAGIVEDVGENAWPLKKGDRVAGFHTIGGPHGSFADYCIVAAHTTFLLPDNISFEAGATLPLNAYMASLMLFQRLELPGPWEEEAARLNDKTALIVYGASSSVGAYAVKLAAFANIHPIIAVGSQSSAFLEQHLKPEKGDKLVDYTKYTSRKALVDAIKDALRNGSGKNRPVYHAVDAISQDGTYGLISEVMSGEANASTGQKPRIAVLTPGRDYSDADPTVDILLAMSSSIHDGSALGKTHGFIWGRLFSDGLRDGWLTPHPFELFEGGLRGIQEALRQSKQGILRGKKGVFSLGKC